MIRKKYLLSFFLLLLVPAIYAQTFTVKADIDSVALLIGEQAKLSFTVSQTPKLWVDQPVFSDSIVQGLEIVERLNSDTITVSPDMIQITQSYIVTGFDSALIYIPAFPFVAEGDTQYSNPLSLKILSVPVDTTQNSIADIKTVYAPPFDWALFFRWALIILLVVAAGVGGYFLYRYYKRNKKTDEVVSEPVDTRLPHEIAFEELEQVRVAHLWQNGRVKEYYTDLTDILREYLNRRYHLVTLEHTSEEILQEMKQQKVVPSQENYNQVKNVFQLSDLVKFAKWNPTPDENDRIYKQVYQFVDDTKEVVETAKSEKDDANDASEEQSSNADTHNLTKE